MTVSEIQDDYGVDYATAIKIKTKLLAYDAQHDVRFSAYDAELTRLRDLLRDNFIDLGGD